MKRNKTSRNKYRWAWFVVLSALFHVTVFAVLLPVLAARGAVRIFRDKENDALKIALLLALLLHLVLLFPLGAWWLRAQEDAAEDVRTFVDLWAEPEEEKTPEEELESYEPEEEMPDGQTVQVPAAGERRRPKRKTRFLSERDNAVDKETASAVRIRGAVSEKPSPEIDGAAGRDPRDRQGGAPEPLVNMGPPAPELPESKDGEVRKTEPGDVALDAVRLQPTESALRAALAGTGLDNLDGVLEGGVTALNTREWNYASFFNRVKAQVETRWHPGREFRNRDPYGNIYGSKDRTTVLLVILRADGSLKKTYVLEPSGAAFLDDEATDALTEAAPFPNVPKGLLDRHDNLVKFTFHFTVRVGEGPVFRMRRY